MNNRTKFGIIGKDISYSFSRNYFQEKFKKLGLTTYQYYNFDIPEIEEFPFLLYHREDEFRGLNVTIPYKEAIIRYLDEVDSEAQKIGAVNTIKVTDDNKLVGYNTDAHGFQKSIVPLLKSHHNKALILGTGGASKAVAYVFKKLNIDYKFVSRNEAEDMVTYEMLDAEIMGDYTIIVNCTPVGTHPTIENAPTIPYQYLSDKHLLYDLIYNPAETKFLQKGKKHGASIKNGLEMLELQAEKAWEIWNS